MNKNRLEAFTDGVMAILITILVLDLKAPHGVHWSDLRQLTEPFMAYLVSFIAIATYWNNHHHLLQATQRITGKVLWANAHLLFWLSLMPLVTSWVGQHIDARLPELCYVIVMGMCGLSYAIFNRVLIQTNGRHSKIAQATQHDWKVPVSLIIYLGSALLTASWPLIGLVGSLMGLLVWLIPNQLIEQLYTK